MGMKVPGNEGSWERKFQGTKVPVPRNKSSTYGTFVPGNESSKERKFSYLRELWQLVPRM